MKEMKNDGATVTLPLRIDLAGGWSDTPPICNAMGGCVLNAAISLEGVLPIKAEVRRIAGREVRVESVDLGRRGVLRSDAEIRDHHDPLDWMALVKSALHVVGYTLRRDGGLDIRISAAVPKGSGLGTSSILGAALVTALRQVLGGERDWRAVSELVLRLEQEMRTGGGWQDQMGALLPGVKLVSSKPGAAQVISVKRATRAAEAAFSAYLEENALLYFTGRKRLARNVLNGVVNFFKDNPDGLAGEIVQTLKADARDAFAAIGQGDWGRFCAVLNGYWLNKKALDPGSTNQMVESTIARIAPWTAAVSLCGAGGGGFMFIVARGPAEKAKIRASLEKRPISRAARFYDFSLLTAAGPAGR
ncbi:MAG: hypothetical protein IJP66_07850 [Kiritimatiellae bacterium]|nr:hypothetical protein [Kiritimatiellia bacterium]